MLIKAGADVNLVDNQMRNPLHLATMMGNHRIVSLLVDRGASVSQQDIDGAIPLHYACNSHIICLNELITAKESIAHINLQQKNGFSPLIIATLSDEPNIIELLIRCGAYVNIKDYRGRSALHYRFAFFSIYKIEKKQRFLQLLLCTV